MIKVYLVYYRAFIVPNNWTIINNHNTWEYCHLVYLPDDANSNDIYFNPGNLPEDWMPTDDNDYKGPFIRVESQPQPLGDWIVAYSTTQ